MTRRSVLNILRVFFKQLHSAITFCIISIFGFIFLTLPITRALPGIQDISGKYAGGHNQTKPSIISSSQKSINNLDGNISPDPVQPVITDLDNGVVDLQWTAPGDDGYEGQAAGYDLRYQISQLGQIDAEEEWLAANQVDGEPQPSPAGQIDSMMVFGLEPDAGYYFCIKAYDEAGNYSGLSNSPLKTADAYDPDCVINIEIIGCGTVHLNPDSEYYQYGDTVIITAEPCEYWEFYGWSGDYNGNDNPITVVVTADINLTATFITDFIPGDANGDGLVQSSDIVYLINFFIGINPPPTPFLAGDANGDCLVISSDVTYLVNYFLLTGPAPIRGDCEQ